MRRLVQVLDWWQRVEFFDLHHPDLPQRFPVVDFEAALGEIHVLDSQGRIFAGFAGTRRMLRALPLAWPLWILLHMPGVGGWLGPSLYRWIARHRYAINRLLGVDLDREGADCLDGVCKIPD